MDIIVHFSAGFSAERVQKNREKIAIQAYKGKYLMVILKNEKRVILFLTYMSLLLHYRRMYFNQKLNKNF